MAKKPIKHFSTEDAIKGAFKRGYTSHGVIGKSFDDAIMYAYGIKPIGEKWNVELIGIEMESHKISPIPSIECASQDEAFGVVREAIKTNREMRKAHDESLTKPQEPAIIKE